MCLRAAMDTLVVADARERMRSQPGNAAFGLSVCLVLQVLQPVCGSVVPRAHSLSYRLRGGSASNRAQLPPSPSFLPLAPPLENDAHATAREPAGGGRLHGATGSGRKLDTAAGARDPSGPGPAGLPPSLALDSRLEHVLVQHIQRSEHTEREQHRRDSFTPPGFADWDAAMQGGGTPLYPSHPATPPASRVLPRAGNGPSPPLPRRAWASPSAAPFGGYVESFGEFAARSQSPGAFAAMETDAATDPFVAAEKIHEQMMQKHIADEQLHELPDHLPVGSGLQQMRTMLEGRGRQPSPHGPGEARHLSRDMPARLWSGPDMEMAAREAVASLVPGGYSADDEESPRGEHDPARHPSREGGNPRGGSRERSFRGLHAANPTVSAGSPSMHLVLVACICSRWYSLCMHVLSTRQTMPLAYLYAHVCWACMMQGWALVFAEYSLLV